MVVVVVVAVVIVCLILLLINNSYNIDNNDNSKRFGIINTRSFFPRPTGSSGIQVVFLSYSLIGLVSL